VNIFVGNLALTTTEQDLRQRFEPSGTVEPVRRMTDRETGRSRGFGCVAMPDGHAAQSAMDARTRRSPLLRLPHAA
jgi:RNA recognition motif-containing protein